MGYKASMIIVQHPATPINDVELIEKLGFKNISLSGETTLEECIYPNDKSINIGHFNGCLIICEDYRLTTTLETGKTPNLLGDYEKVLTDIYPDSEILTAACHSVVNYHLYSLVKNGKKLRFKSVSSDDPVVEFGQRIEEEDAIYANSKIIDGQRMFKGAYDEEEVYDYREDQLMEDFTFGVAKRHLGVMISTTDDEELMFETPFKKYFASKASSVQKKIQTTPLETAKPKGSWLSRLFKK